ncbi:DUF6182 family protein [Streptomyces sp. NPDC006552]|uniref:DUF6182 family protein n=1 Tax=Streptomyces sp. NPDC006552 TaxID=3157179 RepID=UPI0033A42D95
MTLSSETLLTVAADRLRALRPEIAARLDLSTPAALRDAKAAVNAPVADTQDETLVVTVVGDLSPLVWVREACRFALSVPADRAVAWQRSFTRTVYLAGRPDNLRERFAFDHISADGSVAWAGPAPSDTTRALRRLLRTFHGARTLPTWTPTTVEIPEPVTPDPEPRPRHRPPVHRDLYIATAKVTVADALVQVNHLLAEAVLEGVIAPGDHVTLRPVPRLSGLDMPFAALRVDTDNQRPHELRAYAGLTQETAW